MKSIKFVAGLVAGVAVLGAVSAHAAAEAAPLNISITTYVQTKTTNAAGVITYTSTTVTIKSADLVSKLGTSLGTTVPAGSMLGFSLINDDANDVFAGDVVIMSPAGIILWNVSNFGNDTGHSRIYFGFSEDVRQRSSAYSGKVPQPRNQFGQQISQTYSGRGRGNLYFNIYANPTEAVDARVGCYGEFFDDVGSDQYVRGNYGSNLTTGGVNFSGGGEFESYGLDFDHIQPASLSASAAVANVPSDIFFDIF